jgi:hypothetical protein
MKIVSGFAPLLLLIFACKLCSMTGAHDYDPYKGSVKNLLPSQTSVGLINFKLDNSESAEFDGATEGVNADYTQQAGSISVPVKLTVANFPSSQDAAAALKAFADKHNLVLETKTKSGTTVGQRLSWGDGKSIMWSNGSLQCLATSSFAKATSNLEEALPF